jgi:hypothetical protein
MPPKQRTRPATKKAAISSKARRSRPRAHEKDKTKKRARPTVELYERAVVLGDLAGRGVDIPDMTLQQSDRRVVYNRVLHERLCAMVAVGVPIATACQAESINRSTYYEWRKRGQAGEQPFATFWADMQASLARAEASVVQRVTSASLDDWRAGAWYLERRFPQRYRQKQTLTVTKGPSDMSDAELDAAIAKYGFTRAPDAVGDTPQPSPTTDAATGSQGPSPHA